MLTHLVLSIALYSRTRYNVKSLFQHPIESMTKTQNVLRKKHLPGFIVVVRFVVLLPGIFLIATVLFPIIYLVSTVLVSLIPFKTPLLFLTIPYVAVAIVFGAVAVFLRLVTGSMPV